MAFGNGRAVCFMGIGCSSLWGLKFHASVGWIRLTATLQLK